MSLLNMGGMISLKKVYKKIPLSYKYALCLSTEKDDAAQWERYGDSAMGVCISFNVEELYKCLYGYNDITFNRVFIMIL